jgi:hypothetical protein
LLRIALIAGGLLAGVVTGIAKILQSLLPTPPTPLVLVTRAAWGARPPNHEAPNEYGFAATATDSQWYVYPENDLAAVYNTVVIHHSAIALATNETMRSIQDLHMDVNGWADIGYHFAIDKNGVIYEGRDIHARGSSVAGHNTGVIGVVVMGNFEQDYPLDAELTTLQLLVNWLARTYSLTHLAGHSEFNPETVCPGKNLIVYLDQLAQSAGLQRGTGGYVAPS